MTDWVGLLEKSLQRCYDSQAVDEMDSLAALREVLESAPQPVIRVFGRPLTRDRFDKLAAVDAAETIARELSQPGLLGYMVSGSRNGRYIATIRTALSDEEFLGDGKTEALAYSCALSRAVHRLATKGGALNLKTVES